MKTFDEVLASICLIFEQDFDELIDQCFDKLDAQEEETLLIKYLRQGLLVN